MPLNMECFLRTGGCKIIVWNNQILPLKWVNAISFVAFNHLIRSTTPVIITCDGKASLFISYFVSWRHCFKLLAIFFMSFTFCFQSVHTNCVCFFFCGMLLIALVQMSIEVLWLVFLIAGSQGGISCCSKCDLMLGSNPSTSWGNRLPLCFTFCFIKFSVAHLWLTFIIFRWTWTWFCKLLINTSIFVQIIKSWKVQYLGLFLYIFFELFAGKIHSSYISLFSFS